MDADTEVFTDYCHLTVEGNRIVAAILGEASCTFLDREDVKADKKQ